MNRRTFLAGVAGAIAAAPAFGQTKAQRPNIVIFLTDDMGWADVSFHGADFPTPNIDRIAREGVEIERMYTCPVCSPTRVGLMSGRYPVRFGLQRSTIKNWIDMGLPPEEETLADMLARAGYTRRGVFGKWHLGWAQRAYHPLQQGFTRFVGHYGGSIGYHSHKRLGKLDWNHDDELSHEEGYATDLIGKHATRFVEESKTDEPFFLYVPFNAIHTPNDTTLETMARNSDIKDEKRRLKAAMMTSVDDAIGSVIAAIESKGVLDQTLILFMSDNGGVPEAGSSNGPLRGRKHTLYEGGIRVAAAARWLEGGLNGGRKVSAPMSYLDVFPTLMSVAGIKSRKGAAPDGVDVLPQLRGKVTARDDFELFSYFNGKRVLDNKRQSDHERAEVASVISWPWKIVRTGPNLKTASNPREGATIELFNLKDDPYEKSDLSKAQPERVDALLARIRHYRDMQPAKPTPIPLYEPKGWKPPEDWTIPE